MCEHNVELLLGQSRRRWPSIKTYLLCLMNVSLSYDINLIMISDPIKIQCFIIAKPRNMIVILYAIPCNYINMWFYHLKKMKWNESGFRPPLCTYRLNWARRTSWGWWDDWDDTVLQTQDSKFEPWRSEAEHATSRSRRLPTILHFTIWTNQLVYMYIVPMSLLFLCQINPWNNHYTRFVD